MKAEPTARILVEQGYEMGRPSSIHVEVDADAHGPTEVRVGGQAVEVADGIARSAAKEMLDPGLESIAGEFEAKLEQLKHQAFGRARWYAVFAAIIGMASAAAGHYLGF